MKLGFIGSGGIAEKLAATAVALDGVECHAVAARNFEKTKAFQQRFGFARAYAHYEEMLADPDVDLVYVASPHSEHYEQTKACLEHGKPALVEKAFTVNAPQAEELIAMAREKRLLLAEAIWPRYMPSHSLIVDAVNSGVIGEVTQLTATLGYAVDGVPRLQDPALAGGALLDMGVYTLNFALTVFPGRIEKVTADAVLNSRGVDLLNGMLLRFEGGKMAVLSSTAMSDTCRRGVIHGRKGYIVVDNINSPAALQIYDNNYQLVDEKHTPFQINGYEYQLLACKRELEAGGIECHEATHAHTLRMMQLMDEIRGILGVHYPCE